MFITRRNRIFILGISYLFIVITGYILFLQVYLKESVFVLKTEVNSVQLSTFTKQAFGHRPISVPSWRLLPDGINEKNDRLFQQLEIDVASIKQTKRRKIILQYTDFRDKTGSSYFEENCRVKSCTISKDRSLMLKDNVHVDAVMFGDNYYGSRLPQKKRDQIWILFMLESPFHTRSLKPFGANINWTLTYRVDSTIVTPYFKYKQMEENLSEKHEINYAKGKSKLVAWFVSNCFDKNRRLEYARELQKYIQVDIYGLCGSLKCSKSDHVTCHQMVRKDYKFYLAFENSNCKDYITEKPVDHALLQNVIPVVMGASEEAYQRVLPPNSFLHVDNFTSPKELADYLKELDKNDRMYNQYFKWKDGGSWNIIKTHFLCRVCAMLHLDLPPVWYPDINEWWRKNTCKKNAKYVELNEYDY